MNLFSDHAALEQGLAALGRLETQVAARRRLCELGAVGHSPRR